MSEPIELLPCPFCGGEAFLYGLEGEIIKCGTCEAETPERAWNRRANRWSAFSTQELDLFNTAFAKMSVDQTWGYRREIATELARRTDLEKTK